MQIGQRVCRMERAQVAAELHEKKAQHEEHGVSTHDSIELNLDRRYQISNTQNDPVDLYTYVCENQDDLAFSVSLSFEHCVPVLPNIDLTILGVYS